MTIAIAIQATDGIVIAADTLETYGGPGAFKTDQSKIRIIKDADGDGVCAISGAGHADFIDALTDQLADVFILNVRENENVQMRRLGRRVHRFHVNHVLPFAPYPFLERPDVQMLVVLQGRGIEREGRILTSGIGTIRQAFPYAAIGVGTANAKTLLHRFRRRANLRSTAILAAYVIYHVKEAIEACGRYTTIAMLHAPRLQPVEGRGLITQELILPKEWFTEIDQEELDELERAFRRKHARAEKDMLWSFIDDWTKGGGSV